MITDPFSWWHLSYSMIAAIFMSTQVFMLWLGDISYQKYRYLYFKNVPHTVLHREIKWESVLKFKDWVGLKYKPRCYGDHNRLEWRTVVVKISNLTFPKLSFIEIPQTEFSKAYFWTRMELSSVEASLSIIIITPALVTVWVLIINWSSSCVPPNPLASVCIDTTSVMCYDDVTLSSVAQ